MLKYQRTKINEFIRASELRVLGPEGENLGVMSRQDALAKAREFGLDLIEISPNAVPPIARISEYGKYLYEQNKKQKLAKARAHIVEIKNIQIKVGTDENDLAVKAKKASGWLEEGHRIKVDLFLPGRSKYLDKNFLEARFDRLLKLLTKEYNIADTIKKSPKGLTMIIERK